MAGLNLQKRGYFQKGMTGIFGQTLLVAAHVRNETTPIPIFVCPRGSRFVIRELSEVHNAASSAGATAVVRRATSGTAPGSGTLVMSGSFALDSTVNTPQYATLSNGDAGLGETDGENIVESGETLWVIPSGTMGSYNGRVVVSLVELSPRTGTV